MRICQPTSNVDPTSSVGSKPRIRPPSTEKFAKIRALIARQKLHTVCAEAACPNMSECWSAGTATFMILGDTCTRACKFCNVKSGNPKGKIDADEPKNLAESIKNMGLQYAVITCVTRDDLPDGGAEHFVNCIEQIKQLPHPPLIELLISDLNGNTEALETIIKAKPDVLAHNIETVERLQTSVRDPRISYTRSLQVLSNAKKIAQRLNIPIITKSSIMLGLGETEEELIQAMKDLRAHDTDILTLGQYLAPSPLHHPIFKFYTPEEFKAYELKARELNFRYCASGALVRSSYKAGEAYEKAFYKHH